MTQRLRAGGWLGIVSLGLVLSACDDSLSLHFGGRLVPPVKAPPVWEQSCDEALIQRTPLEDQSDIYVQPPGTPQYWDGMPAPGLLVARDRLSIPSWNLVAPADGLLLPTPQGTNTVELRICRDVTVRLDAVLPFVDVPGSEPTDAGGRFVRAGMRIAQVLDGHHFVYALTDQRVSTPRLHPERSDFLDHAACPLAHCDGEDTSCHAYMTDTQREQWASLLQDHTGAAVSADNACGIYPTEREETALGVWFPPDAGPSDAGPISPLALSDDPSGASYGIISNGRFQADPNPEVFPTIFEGFFWFPVVSPPDGLHNNDLSLVTLGPDGGPGTVHCYDGLTYQDGTRSGSVVILQMEDSDTLLAEAQIRPGCDDFRGADGGYTFPMLAPIRLSR